MPDFLAQVNRDIRGGLDTNSDEINISGGNYPSRVNVVRNNDGSFGSDTPELGDVVAYEIPDIELQSQRVRIYLDDPFFSGRLTLKNSVGQVVKQTSFNSAPAISANKQQIVNVISGWALDATFFNNSGNVPAYIDVEIPFSYDDWTLELRSAPTIDTTVDYRVVTIYEAISETGAGEAYLIGSWQANSLEFRCYTTQRNVLTKDKDIQTIQNFGGRILVQIPGHGLVNNESIIMARMSGLGTALNGQWTVEVLDQNSFYLNNAVATGFPNVPTSAYGGFFYRNPYGYSFVLVQSYDSTLQQYNYSIPLRSKKINWNTKNQVDIDVLYFNNTYALYPTDFYNRPYVFYFNDPLSNDSGIEALNDKGRYSYNELASQIIRHKDNNTSFVTVGTQQQSGGNLQSASYRYGTVLRTFEGSETEISDLSPIISVYEPVYNGTSSVFGTLGPTNKVNRILVNDIPSGIYQFIDLIAVIIVGQESNTTATEAIVVSSTQLGPDQTSIELEHSGNETDSRFFDLGKLNPVRSTPIRIKTNRLGENRLFEGNLETSERFDITEWAKTMRYGINKFPVFSDFGAQNVNGFAQPFVREVGYQVWEWYRFYAVGEFTEGGITDATFAFDVRFVSQQDYIDSFGTDDDFRFLSSNETDRRDFGIDDFINYDLGQGDREYFQFGINITIDWDFQFDGIPARNIFKKIKICRAERIKEVLSTGISAPSKQMATVDFSGDNLRCFVSEAVIGAQYNGWNKAKRAFQGTVIPLSELDFAEFDDNLERVVTYYSPDLLFKSEGDLVGESDYFIRIGSQNKNTQVPISPTTSPNAWRSFDCAWDIYDGRLGSQIRSSKHLITSSFTCDIGQSVPLPENNAIDNDFEGVAVLFTKGILEFFTIPNNSFPEPNGLLPIYLAGNRFSSRVYFLDTKLPQTTSEFYGVHNTIRFRSIKNKYGITSSSIDVLYTGYDLLPSQTESIVFGGDVYTQQTWFRQTFERLGFPISGGGIGFNIISQNTLNTQLKVVDITNTTNPSFPTPTPFDVWIKSQTADQRVRNSAYQQILNQQYLPVYNPDELDINKYPTRIRWSESTPNGAVRDFNTIFLPGAFRDNPLSFGEIEMLDFKQGELFTLQQLCYTREFANNYGRLSTIEDGNVTIGDASVLARDGIRLTQLGSKHRWSYARGLTDAGNDVRLWVNSDFFVVMRAGADGSVNLTTRTMMDTFMRKYMRYVSDRYTPADGQGIHATWDNRGKRFIVTARGWKQTKPWSAGIGYQLNAEVNFGVTYAIDQIYVCVVPHVSDFDNQPGTELGNQYWEKISLKNPDYYSVWSLCFNEQINRFTEENEYYPKIYSNHFDRLFSQNPYIGEAKQHCLHREGEPLVFYGREHEGHTEYVINIEAALNKKFIATRYGSLYAPYKVEYLTQFIGYGGIDNRFTRLTETEFSPRENGFFSPIKMVLNSQGQNDRRTKDMRGIWLRIKTFFKARQFQKINNIFVSVRAGQRNVKNP